MIKQNHVKKLIRKRFNKKIGNIAIKKLDQLAESYLIEIINKASRKADISGRIIIKEQDIE